MRPAKEKSTVQADDTSLCMFDMLLDESMGIPDDVAGNTPEDKIVTEQDDAEDESR